MAAQFTLTKGLFFLELLSCIALAMISLPVPLSPLTRTVEVDLEAFSAIDKQSFRELFQPIIDLKEELKGRCRVNSFL